jgi:hypothetical protein
VNVGPDDQLNVRAQASPEAELVGKLAFDAAGITATGQICELGEIYWYEIQHGATRGWVNGKFLGPTLKPVDVTAELEKRANAAGAASTPALLAEALRAQLTPPPGEGEGKFTTSVLGLSTKGDEATAELRSCCGLDDAVAGQQTTVRMKKTGASWKLVSATRRTLCYRGVNESGDRCS